MRLGTVFIVVCAAVVATLAAIVACFIVFSTRSVDHAVAQASAGDGKVVRSEFFTFLLTTGPQTLVARSMMKDAGLDWYQLPTGIDTPTGTYAHWLVPYERLYNSWLSLIHYNPFFAYVYATQRSPVDPTVWEYVIASALYVTAPNGRGKTAAFPVNPAGNYSVGLTAMDFFDENVVGQPWPTEIGSLTPEHEATGHWHACAPYKDPISGLISLLLTFTSPTHFDPVTKKCVAAVSVDVNISEVVFTLRRLAAERGSEIYILDVREKQIVTHSLPNKTLSLINDTLGAPWPWMQTPDPRTNALVEHVVTAYGGYDKMRASTADALIDDYGDDIVSVKMYEFADLKHAVVSRSARDSYLGSTRTVFAASVAGGCVAVVLSFVIFVLTHRAVVTPIASIVHSMRLISSLSDETASSKEPPALDELKPLHSELLKLELAIRGFTRYCPKDVVRELLVRDSLNDLTMQPFECSMLFCDIVSFTAICERVPTDELSRLIKVYFEVQCNTVQAYDGIVDKLIGDCVMAIWGAPQKCPQHQMRSALAALEMSRNAQRDPIAGAFAAVDEVCACRTGVAAGVVLAGNMGTTSRLSYSVIGDAVNLAARLESLNKQFGTFVIADEGVAMSVGNIVVTRLLGRVAVVGKEIAVGVYELVGVGAANSSLTAVPVGGAQFSSKNVDTINVHHIANPALTPTLQRSPSGGDRYELEDHHHNNNNIHHPGRRMSADNFSQSAKSKARSAESNSMYGAGSGGAIKIWVHKLAPVDSLIDRARQTAPATAFRIQFCAKYSLVVAAFLEGRFRDVVAELQGIETWCKAAASSGEFPNSTVLTSWDGRVMSQGAQEHDLPFYNLMQLAKQYVDNPPSEFTGVTIASMK